MNAFEKQVANEASREAGPSRSVDVVSIVRAATATTSAGRASVVMRWFGGGRTSAHSEGGISMFSAVKIVAAAAIVALFGGFLLIDVVGDPQEGEPLPAAESPSPSAETTVETPIAFGGTFSCSTYWEDGNTENVVLGPVEGGNLVQRQTRGETGRLEAEMDDPRLGGDWTVYTSTDEYFWPGVDPSLPLVMAPGVLHITNDDGSWQLPWGYFALPGAMNIEEMDGLGYLAGSGGYEGLSAMFHLSSDNWDDCHCWVSKGLTAESERCRFEMEGLIIEGVPPIPEAPE